MLLLDLKHLSHQVFHLVEAFLYAFNFDVDNFSVRECGTVVDCIREAEARFEDSDLNPNDGNGDLQETLL